jgi:hypothetical protein
MIGNIVQYNHCLYYVVETLQEVIDRSNKGLCVDISSINEGHPFITLYTDIFVDV